MLDARSDALREARVRRDDPELHDEAAYSETAMDVWVEDMQALQIDELLKRYLFSKSLSFCFFLILSMHASVFNGCVVTCGHHLLQY